MSGTQSLPSQAQWDRAAREPRVQAFELDPVVLDTSLLGTIAKVAERTPEVPAFSDAGRILSYRGVLQEVEALGNAIRKTPAPPGPVAVLLGCDATSLIALLAPLVAGRPCLPLDNTQPRERLRAMITQAKASIIVTTDAGKVEVTRNPEIPAVAGDADAGSGLDDPAIILPTSGSTGQPRLIVHSQRTLAYRALVRVHSAMLKPGTRVLAAGVLSSYAAVCHHLAVLVVGASASIVDLRREGLRAILTTMIRDRIEVLRSGVSIARALSEMEGARAAAARLRLCWMGGEVMKPADVPVLRSFLPEDCVLLNGYGATESISFHWIVPSVLPPLTTTLPIGYPNPGAEVLLLNDEGEVCAPGEPGEMVTRSPYNALGEWQDGKLAQGRLIRDPAAPGQRVYFSGDYARRLEDGAVVVLGRKDRMVKINGLRVEPAEIETALLTCGPVADAAVLPQVVGDTTRLLAFVTPRADTAPPDPAALRVAVRGILPAHMVPARVIVLPEFPRLGSGKVDGVTLLRDHGR